MFYGWYSWENNYIKIKPFWYTVSIRATQQLTEDGFRIPARFGFARYDFDIDVRYYALIPFNLVIALWWWLRTEIRFGIARRLGFKFEHILRDTYNKGYKNGKRDGIALERDFRNRTFLGEYPVPPESAPEVRRDDE